MLFVFVAEEFDQLLRTGCQLFYLRVRVPQTKVASRSALLQHLALHLVEPEQTRDIAKAPRAIFSLGRQNPSGSDQSRLLR